MAQQLKTCLPMQDTRETQVRSLGGEDPLEKDTATHSSILAWRMPWRGEPGGLHSPWGRRESDTHACMMLTCKKGIPISSRVKFKVFTEVNSILQDLAAPVSTPQKITAEFMFPYAARPHPILSSHNGLPDGEGGPRTPRQNMPLWAESN